MSRHQFQARKNSLELLRACSEGGLDAAGVDGRTEKGRLLNRSYSEVEARRCPCRSSCRGKTEDLTLVMVELETDLVGSTLQPADTFDEVWHRITQTDVVQIP
jgi:hypothetical protein